MPKKSHAEVWGECRSLGRTEVRSFMLLHNRLPPEAADCSPQSALFLYLADVLRYEGHEPNHVLSILRFYLDDLVQFAVETDKEIECKAPLLPVLKLVVYDNRFVALQGTGLDTCLDLESGFEVGIPSAELKSVSYNLTSVMLVRWAGVPLAPRPQTPEPTDGSHAAEDPAAGG